MLALRWTSCIFPTCKGCEIKIVLMIICKNFTCTLWKGRVLFRRNRVKSLLGLPAINAAEDTSDDSAARLDAFAVLFNVEGHSSEINWEKWNKEQFSLSMRATEWLDKHFLDQFPIKLVMIFYPHLKNCTNAMIRPPKAAVPKWKRNTIPYAFITVQLEIFEDRSAGAVKYLSKWLNDEKQNKEIKEELEKMITFVLSLRSGMKEIMQYKVELLWEGTLEHGGGSKNFFREWLEEVRQWQKGRTHHLATEIAIIRDPIPAIKFIVHNKQKVRNQSCSPACRRK